MVHEIVANLNIGINCKFGANNHIVSLESVKISNNVLFANNFFISDNIHEYEDITKKIIRQLIRFKKNV